MNYPIPSTLQEMIELRQQPVSEELVAAAIAGVVKIARSQHQSLEEVKTEVLADDRVLNLEQRLWLSDLITQAWNGLG
ncbi:MAG: hypothetical protein ACP5D7_03015 [Limnospira sp.]